MEDCTFCGEPNHNKPGSNLTEFIELFALLHDDEKLFPKICRTCGKNYGSFPEYVLDTVAKGHCLEDCSEVMHKPFTMMYRHCKCGNTLVLTLTKETFPRLDDFWAMLRKKAHESAMTLHEVVMNFAQECEHSIVARQEDRVRNGISEKCEPEEHEHSKT
ncbi:MAG: hypothetical protein WCJ75_05420 [Desulfomonile sp.]|jgi:hypothetical protein